MLSIDTLQPDDLPATAALHEANLRLGLFPRMGSNFLCLYQETFALSPYGIALVAHGEDGVVGALFGTTSNPDHLHWVVQNRGVALACYGSAALLMRPQVAWMFATTRVGRYANGLRRHIGPSSSTGAGTKTPGAPMSVLSHIVTAQDQRRRGIGRELVEEFKLRARQSGAPFATLITEEGGLGTPFFERLGCECVGRRSGQDGCIIREYHLSLDEVDVDERARRRGNRNPVDADWRDRGSFPEHDRPDRRFH